MTTNEIKEAIKSFKVKFGKNPISDELLAEIANNTGKAADEADLFDGLDSLARAKEVKNENGRYELI